MTWVLYGATGFTGELLAAEAVRRGHRPVLAGRNAGLLRPVAERLGLEWKAVSLEDSAGLRALLEGHAAVLHAAGPFARTSKPMADACLDTRTHYLDITGELEVFEALYARDAHARERGVVLLPGAGFDVVPTDCLAVFLAQKVKQPRRLDLALSVRGTSSTGTAKSAVGMVAQGGRVRRDGALVEWPLGRGTHKVRFSSREAWVTPAPLGDLLSAGLSTKIPDITISFAVPSNIARIARLSWPLGVVGMPMVRALFGMPGVRDRAERFVGERVKRPTPRTDDRVGAYIWGEVEGSDGEVKQAWLETCEGYRLTAQTGVRLVELVLSGGLTKEPGSLAGAMSPAMVGGPDFVLEFQGSRRLEQLAS